MGSIIVVVVFCSGGCHSDHWVLAVHTDDKFQAGFGFAFWQMKAFGKSAGHALGRNFLENRIFSPYYRPSVAGKPIRWNFFSRPEYHLGNKALEVGIRRTGLGFDQVVRLFVAHVWQREVQVISAKFTRDHGKQFGEGIDFQVRAIAK